ncbi:hypothetical protein D3C84_1167680 [compost metagenome]
MEVVLSLEGKRESEAHGFLETLQGLVAVRLCEKLAKTGRLPELNHFQYGATLKATLYQLGLLSEITIRDRSHTRYEWGQKWGHNSFFRA